MIPGLPNRRLVLSFHGDSLLMLILLLVLGCISPDETETQPTSTWCKHPKEGSALNHRLSGNQAVSSPSKDIQERNQSYQHKLPDAKVQTVFLLLHIY
jgi:hypothetical protein